MGKHSNTDKIDKEKNKVALAYWKKGDKDSALAVLKTTSRKNQIEFIQRVKRGLSV